MRTLAKRVLITGAALLAFVVCVAAVLFKFAEHRIAARMRPPQIARESEAANDMAFRTLDGQVKHLADAKGHVVFLNLWGTWCIQCVAEMPTIQRLYERYRNDPRVEFLAVSRLDAYRRNSRSDATGPVSRDVHLCQRWQPGDETCRCGGLGRWFRSELYRSLAGSVMNHRR